ncbi:MAG TPA: glycosyltransferase family 39 protein [Terracidiphilus sp.]
MKQSFLWKLLAAYSSLLVLCGAGYALWDRYQLDGDAVSFMDISDAIVHKNWSVVANAYWNPGYAFALAAGQIVAHPSRWNELQVFYWVNFVIFIFCVAATIYFALSLAHLREQLTPDVNYALSPAVVVFAALSLMFFSFQRELSIGKVRSDALMYLFLFLAASLLMRIQATRKFIYFPLLGCALGLAYLTKSFAVLPSALLMLAIFIFGLRRKGRDRTHILVGTVVCAIIFVALAGPYIHAISIQRGRITIGDSARINYAYYVDGNTDWWAWASGNVNHARDDFKHPEQLLLSNPQTYSFARHMNGTYPLWFDPSYWFDTVYPQVYLKGHIRQAAQSGKMFIIFLFDHPEAFLLLFVLLLAGAQFPRARVTWTPFLPVMLWGLLMIGIYFPLAIEERYITFSFLFVVIPLLAALVRPADQALLRDISTALVLLLACVSLFSGIRDEFEQRRMDKTSFFPFHHLSTDIYSAAQGLTSHGIHPGDEIACMGALGCHLDIYWERLARVQVVDEIIIPRGSSHSDNPAVYWQSLQNVPEVVDVLRRDGAAAIVSEFPAGTVAPAGWQNLNGSRFYALFLTGR